mgnify:CR=1 FL=1
MRSRSQDKAGSRQGSGKKNVEEEYRDEITAVTLAPQDDRQQTEPVIAIGSPNGDTNSLILRKYYRHFRKAYYPGCRIYTDHNEYGRR